MDERDLLIFLLGLALTAVSLGRYLTAHAKASNRPSNPRRPK